MTQHTVVDLTTVNNKKILTTSAVLIGIGLVVLLLPLVNGGGADAWVPAGVTAGVFVLIGLVPVLGRKVFLRRQRLLFDPTGIRWDDAREPWAVGWDELAAVTVFSTATEKVTRVLDSMPGGRDGYVPVIRLNLYPADPQACRAAHPEMEHLWQVDGARAGYRVPLGPNPELVPQLERGIGQYDRTGVYRGVVDEQ